MHFKETFGELIRKLREKRGLPIRKVAAYLDIDPSTLSKIERNERSANREMINNLAEIFDVDVEYLLINFLSDKISYDLLNEQCSEKVLQAAEEKIKYFRSKLAQQSKLKL
ncbi:helix-turn-helix domain-containing protein [Fulvivirga ulvae]|uniref:helix-turn-helix domain-containing protein n=1 Tax=Fulvivirga ulvae TaxID=2904245 RepID=UPI001F1D79C8|nr:helix-turn-helix transcriptional regulator [Fulvivirga ulvae]UII31109.1 helix-turn-helix domain-containing protein [Fulvivirga ulvae]